MRSSTRSENINNSDNMNNTVEDDRDRGSADDIIDVTSNESTKLNSQARHSESESSPRADTGENDKSEKINVYEQVVWRLFLIVVHDHLIKIRHSRLHDEKKPLPWSAKRASNVFSQ